MSDFHLSNRSLENLEGVHPDLIKVIKRAIEITKVDFGVGEGLRTRERQRELVESGASQTMNSRHLTGHAADLIAYVAGKPSWDWPLYYKIAEAMQQAAEELKIQIVWGGCWNNLLLIDDPHEATQDYAARKRAKGQPAFMDGPHYELSRDFYKK